MKKIIVCLLTVSVLTGCGMSDKEKMALVQAEQETNLCTSFSKPSQASVQAVLETIRLEIQKQRELAEQARLSRLTPEQRHAEDLAKITTKQ